MTDERRADEDDWVAAETAHFGELHPDGTCDCPVPLRLRIAERWRNFRQPLPRKTSKTAAYAG